MIQILIVIGTQMMYGAPTFIAVVYYITMIGVVVESERAGRW